MPVALFVVGSVMAFLYGITIGSFLNVCIYRLPLGESLLSPPSHCPSCNNRLRPRDLVPLLSYLALRGKCRFCGIRITPRYFIIEFITGLLFSAFWLAMALRYQDAVWSFPVIVMLVMACIFVSAMLVTFMIDLETTYVIEPVTWVAMGAGVIYEVMHKWFTVQDLAYTVGGITIPFLPAAVPGMIIGFLFFVVMDLFGRLIFRKPSMGLGDAFIGAAIGAMLGPKLALLSFGLAVFSCVIISIPLIAFGSLKRQPAPGAEEERKTEEEELPEGLYIPFGPFLTASAVLIALMPDWFATRAVQLWQWWLYSNPFMG